MAPTRLRLRLPTGQSTLTATTFGELVTHIDSCLPSESGKGWQLLTGYPPQPMASRPPSDATLSDYVSSGETVVVRVIDAPGAAAPTPVAAAPTPTPAPPPAFDEEQDEDMKLAMALSLGAAPPQPVAAPAMAAPAMAAGTDGERLVRRVIPADNSCLFAAVAHAMEGSAGRRVRADGLRRIVAEAVKADGGLMYGEAVLGQPVEAYMKWIMQDSSWGGGIELAILADHYGVELTALDVQSLRVDAFGSGKGYANRALVLYDGIHYDLIVRPTAPHRPRTCLHVCAARMLHACCTHAARMLHACCTHAVRMLHACCTHAAPPRARRPARCARRCLRRSPSMAFLTASVVAGLWCGMARVVARGHAGAPAV